MGNTVSTSRRNEHRSRGRQSFVHVTRTAMTSLRRYILSRPLFTRALRNRSADFEAFQRLLREEYSVHNTSQSEIAEHLVTLHVSFAQTFTDCVIYVTGYNSNHDKILDGIINQDMTRNCGSECFFTYTMPQSGNTTDRRFRSPFNATEIKEFLLQFSPEPADSSDEYSDDSV